LTTQFYLPNHPGNASDWLYQRIPVELRERVTMDFSATDGMPVASLDLVI
jgi:protocatechuate 3,4-dioxygenase beta subunit